MYFASICESIRTVSETGWTVDRQVMQIFYPYSIQQYLHEFPGEDPRDCPRNVNKEQSVSAVSLFFVASDMRAEYGTYR